jgi:hypothetical protein
MFTRWPIFLPTWQKILTGAGNTVRKEVGGTLRSDEGVNGVTSKQKEGVNWVEGLQQRRRRG